MNQLCFLPKRLLIILLLFYTVVGNAQHSGFINRIKNLDSKDRCRVFLGYIEENNIANETLPPFLNTVEQFAKSVNDKGLINEIEFINLKSDIYKKYLYNYPEQVAAFTRLLNDYQERGKLLFQGYCLHHLGQLHFQNEEYDASFECSFKAMKIYEEIGFNNVPNISKFLHDLALNHYYFKDCKEVIRLIHIPINGAIYNKSIDIQRYNNIALAYMKLNSNDSAMHYLNKTLAQAIKYKSKIWEGISYSNLGEFYYKTNDFPKSLLYFKKYHFYDERDKKVQATELSSYLNLAKVYVKLDSVKQAKAYLDSVKNILPGFKITHLGEQQQLEKYRKHFFRTTIEYFKKTGDFIAASTYHDSLNLIQSAIDEKYNAARIKASANNVIIKENEQKLAEVEKAELRLKLIYLAVILGIVTISCIIYFKEHKAKLKKKRESERLLAEKKLASLEQKAQRREIDEARNQITQFLTKITEQDKILHQFKSAPNKAELNVQDDTKQLAVQDSIDTLKKIRILTDEDWQHFSNSFEKLFPQLAKAMKDHKPTITISEKRYLMLRQLEFTHKQMAGIIGVSDGTIRVTLNRVRKKLNETADTPHSDLIDRLLRKQTDY